MIFFTKKKIRNTINANTTAVGPLEMSNLNAMKMAIIERNNIDFNDRKPILQKFKIDSIILKMNLAFGFGQNKKIDK